MSDNVEQTTGGSTNEPQGEEVSNLPSEEGQNEINADAWKLPDEILKERIKDGKLDGRFSSAEELYKNFRELEAKNAELGRKYSNEVKGKTEDVTKIQAQAELVQKQEEVKAELVPKILENSLQITDDVLAQAKEVGLDPIELENLALKAERVKNEAFSIVGGEQNYKSMLVWAQENLTETEIKAFDDGLNSPYRQRLIKSLWNDFQSSGGQVEPNQEPSIGNRFKGDSTPAGLKGYETLIDLRKDLNYIESGRATEYEVQRYKQRLALTDPRLYGMR